jgi:protein SCO1/2
MVDQDGRAVDQRILSGRWSAVFFGYTYCPDVCPTTLQTLAAAATRLGPRGKDLQVVFVSVDPERDTPAQLKTYLSNQAFPARTIGLTGTPEQVSRIARAYRVYYARQGQGPGYSVDHSAAIFLMNPRGQFDRVLSESFGPDRIAQQIGEAESRG